MVTIENLLEAFDRMKMGVTKSEKSLVIDRADKESTAVRELGIAMTSIWNNTKMNMYKVTILPSGDNLGNTILLPKNDETSQSKQEILELIDLCLAGRVAE